MFYDCWSLDVMYMAVGGVSTNAEFLRTIYSLDNLTLDQPMVPTLEHTATK